MAFTVNDIRIHDVTSLRHRAGPATLERGIPIGQVLSIDSISSELFWVVRMGFSSDASARVHCAANVLDPGGLLIATAWLSFLADVGEGWRETLLSPFSARVAGFYTVRLMIERPDPATRDTRIAVDFKPAGDRASGTAL